jgi:hypothetical protein
MHPLNASSYRSWLPIRRAAATLTLGILVSGSGWSATLFDDDFTGVTNPNTVGYYFTSGSNNTESAWIISTNNTSPLSGNVLTHPTGWATNTWAYKQFQLVSLSSVGDYVRLQLDFVTPAVTSGSFGLSMMYSANTITANDFSGTNPLSDSEGYSFFQAFGSSATSPSYRVIEDNSNPQYSSTIFTPTQSTNSSDGNGHSLALTLTLTAGGLQISSSIDGTIFNSYTVASGAMVQFNTLRLSNADTGQWFYYDNISMETNVVPEPSVAVLLALGAGVFFLRRRGLPSRVAAVAIACAVLSPLAQASQIVDVKTTAVGDGDLQDASGPWDDVPEKIDDMGMGAKVGSNYSTHCKAVFEFALPPKDAGPVRSAALKLFCNGQNDGEALATMDVDVYGYSSEQADGSLDGNEWAEGELIGQILVKGETDLAQHKLPAFDVTKFVQESIEAGKKYVGFRVEARDMDRSTQNCLVLRTAEFDEQYPGNAPTLVLDIE